MEKPQLVESLKQCSQDELINDLADLLIGINKAVDNLGLKNGLNMGSLSSSIMKMQFNPKGFSDEIGITDLKPLYEKYQTLFD